MNVALPSVIVNPGSRAFWGGVFITRIYSLCSCSDHCAAAIRSGSSCVECSNTFEPSAAFVPVRLSNRGDEGG